MLYFDMASCVGKINHRILFCSFLSQDEVRISKKDFESENAKMYGGQERWHHVECFAKLRDELEFWESGDCLPGIKSLTKEDQQLVKSKLPKVEK